MKFAIFRCTSEYPRLHTTAATYPKITPSVAGRVLAVGASNAGIVREGLSSPSSDHAAGEASADPLCCRNALCLGSTLGGTGRQRRRAGSSLSQKLAINFDFRFFPLGRKIYLSSEGFVQKLFGNLASFSALTLVASAEK
ncbi:hypothetical protein CDAR_480171 [Caerostris darwini]|uniref:Uncharacterized protein n=1 Tax=Caerostris darwini TaxID=1538125 RepID=A0AAV4V0S3_9ARAC|nr:hypothetical protein CDAR_480171 [Caerostris darwini]